MGRGLRVEDRGSEPAALVVDVDVREAGTQGDAQLPGAVPREPAAVIGALNDFLAACTNEINEAGGVVIDFTGDGLLATFNTPLEIDEPERQALAAAERLLDCGTAHGFKLRIGLAAGAMAAGSIGSRERQAFTVYGDTVNRAARLETLGKELGYPILVDSAVRTAVDTPLKGCGEHQLRGLNGPVSVWALGAAA